MGSLVVVELKVLCNAYRSVLEYHTIWYEAVVSSDVLVLGFSKFAKVRMVTISIN
jgi:hypothetical protein